MSKRILLDEKLKTKRLVFRSRLFDDNAFVFEATRYPGFNDGMSWEPPVSIAEMFDRYHETLEKWVSGNAYSFVIVDKEIDQRVGMISIRKTEKENVWDIGYWTHPEMQNKGYMQEAVSGILVFGFDRLNASSIEAKYALWNKGSERVLEKCGMRKVGFIENGFMKNGKAVEENRVEIKKEDWKQG